MIDMHAGIWIEVLRDTMKTREIVIFSEAIQAVARVDGIQGLTTDSDSISTFSHIFTQCFPVG